MDNEILQVLEPVPNTLNKRDYTCKTVPGKYIR